MPAAELNALAARDHAITATLTDKAGNSNSATHDVAVNLTAPVLTIDTVSDDDVINSTEKTQDLTLTGTASGLAAGAIRSEERRVGKEGRDRGVGVDYRRQQ